MTKYIQFRTKSIEGYRPYLITFNVNNIKQIKTQVGSENVYLEVNGITVEGSYETLLALLSCETQEQEIELLSKYRHIALADFKVIRIYE